jgi:hypothetical protein
VVLPERLLAATTPMIPITTIAPTTIQSHGTLLVVVLVVVVVPSEFVVLSVVVAEPAFGAVADPPVVEPFVAGPVVVVVVEPLVPAACAKVITGAMARKRASSIRLRRKIGRMCFLPADEVNMRLLPHENRI